MPDKVAVIASVLKPVDDTRMYEKLGRSIRETNKYQVNIIGFNTKKPITDDGITFHTLYRGGRTSVQRLFAGWNFFRLLIKLKPTLVITCTPELLVPASLYKMIYNSKLWYDVQENYRRNIRYQAVYPALLKPLLSAAIGLIEYGTRPMVNHYLLAEKGYLKELSFVKNKHTVLENKYVPPGEAPKRGHRFDSNQHKTDSPVIKDDNDSNPGTKELLLIFTGTCSRENGILQAISLVTSLREHGKPIRLQIVGHVPDSEILALIQQEQAQRGSKWIQLIGNGELVPHQTILEYAAKADYGLVAHQPNPSNENCIPTKIYEYLGLRLPMILQEH